MFEAQPWTQNKATRKVLPLKRNSRFFFIHNPKNWELYRFKRGKKTVNCLLPSFSSLRVTAGTNGIRENGAAPDSAVTRTRYNDQGVKVLNPVEHDYLRVYECHKGSYYTDKWTKIEIIGNTPIFSYDHEGFAEFRRNLVLDGHIKLPHEAFMKLMLINTQRLIDKYALDQHIPERAIKLKARQEDFKAIKDFQALLKDQGVKCYDF